MGHNFFLGGGLVIYFTVLSHRDIYLQAFYFYFSSSDWMSSQKQVRQAKLTQYKICKQDNLKIRMGTAAELHNLYNTYESASKHHIQARN
jgi:hypothetical protein